MTDTEVYIDLAGGSGRKALATADKLAAALSLDMAALWRPTVRSYFGRVPAWSSATLKPWAFR